MSVTDGTEVPEMVRDAAEMVAGYFRARGAETWVLGSIRSHRPSRVEPDPRVIDATHVDLSRALAAKDHPPEGLPDIVAAATQHLGLCCLGGRVLRLKLPNGRTLRVTLE